MRQMKVAMTIANEMLASHSEEIKYLSKEALRHEIKLIVDKEWASSEPEKLIDNVEQEIQKLTEAKKKERDKTLEPQMDVIFDSDTYVTTPVLPEQKLLDRKSLEKPVKLRNPYSLYHISYDWNFDDDKSGSET